MVDSKESDRFGNEISSQEEDTRLIEDIIIGLKQLKACKTTENPF